MESLATTNIWLGILAVVSLVELLIILGAGIIAYLVYRRVTHAIESVERDVAPLYARADRLLDDLQRLVDKANDTQDSVVDAFKHVADTGAAVAGVVRAKTWPVMGVILGLKSAAAALRRNGRKGDDSKYSRM